MKFLVSPNKNLFIARNLTFFEATKSYKVVYSSNNSRNIVKKKRRQKKLLKTKRNKKR